MASCLPKSKHVKLTLACYPKSKTAAAKPNSSELQYLTYYAASRPKKLIKVGAFIRQKTIKDTYWKRQNEVIISLDICTALIEKCHHNLNLFVADVVDILDSALRTKDGILIEHTLHCFSVLCKQYDGSALGTSESFTSKYEGLLHEYCSITQEGPGLNEVGIKALYSACRSKALQTQQTTQLQLLLSVALANLMPARPEVLYQLYQSTEQEGDKRPRSIPATRNSEIVQETKSVASEHILVSYSLEILHNILLTNDAVRIRRVTKQIIQYKAADDFPTSNTAILTQFAAEWVSIDLRFHVLGACLESLQHVKQETTLPTPLQNHVVHVVCALLNSKISLIGLSFNDVLDILFDAAYRLLMTTTLSSEDLSHALSEQDRKQATETHFLRNLAAAMAALTMHTYYKTQTSDIFRNIMLRCSKQDSTRTVSTCNIQLLHLYVAKLILTGSQAKKDVSQFSSKISLSAFVPGLCLMNTDDLRLQQKFRDLLLDYVNHIDTEEITDHTTDARSMAEAGKSFRSSISRYLLDNVERPHDFQAGLAIIAGLQKTLTNQELALFIPLLYRVDEACFGKGSYVVVYAKQSSRSALLALLERLATKCEVALTVTNSGASYEPVSRLPAMQDALPASLVKEDSLITQEQTAQDQSAGDGQYVSRNRLVSSASASREALVRGNDTPTTNQSDVGLIHSLKRALLLPEPASDLTSSSVEQMPTLDDLFEGYVLQPMPKSTNMLDQSVSTMAMHDRSSASTVPEIESQKMSSASSTNLFSTTSDHRLGVQIA